MTHDEAIEKVINSIRHRGPSQMLVDSLIALDILKVETPEDDLRASIIRTLAARSVAKNAAGLVTEYGAVQIIDWLAQAGLKIVRQDPR